MAKLEDFGQKIGGARKDYIARGITVSTYDDMNSVERDQLATKDYIWPKPDYAKMISDGVDPIVAFRVKMVRERLPSQLVERGATWVWRDSFDFEPRRRAYVHGVNAIKDAVAAVRKIEDFEKVGALYEGFDKETKAALDMVPGRRRLTPFPRLLNPSVSNYQQYEYDRAARTGWPTPSKTTKKPRRKYPERELAENPTRIGRVDFRHGRNATPEMFMETFGLRGGEFGNWVDQAERQRSLNMAFDAFCDLSEVLQIPKTSIGLNKTLSIAFGSRGKGGGNASAHYEPARRVINLTKPHGSGALCHEWFHGFDHYVGSGEKDTLLLGSESGGKAEEDVPAAALAVRRAVVSITKRPRTDEESKVAVEADGEKARSVLGGWLRRRLGGANLAAVQAETHPMNSDFVQANDALMGGDEKALEQVEAFCKAIDPDLPKMDEVHNGFMRRCLATLGSAQKQLNSGVFDEKLIATNFVSSAQKWDSYRSKAYYAQPAEISARAFEAFIEQKLNDGGFRNEYLVHGTQHPDLYPVGRERGKLLTAFGDSVTNTAQTVLGKQTEADLPQLEALELPGRSVATRAPLDSQNLVQGGLW